MRSDDEDTSLHTPFDPSVDVLVGLIAIVLLATMLFLSIVDFSKKRETLIKSTEQAIGRNNNLRHNGQPTQVFIARNDALHLIGTEKTQVTLDEILDSPVLKTALENIKSKIIHPVIFITEKGQESAFLFETVLYQSGIGKFSKIYLDRSCDFFDASARPEICGVPKSVLPTGISND